MRVDEELALRHSMEAVSAFAKNHTQLWAFFNDVDDIPLPSLQNASFDSDVAYFKKVSFVLSAVQSIAHKPHVVVRNVETIVRADIAGTLSNESFQQTLRDPALWKQKRRGISPEYVHHTESIDEVCIYENFFVIMVLNIIQRSLHHYEEFYANSIKSMSSASLTLDGDKVLTVFGTIKRLFRKLERIKKTDFYKTVIRHYVPLRYVEATNILKHDRLYNVVYRFYHESTAYADEKELISDLLSYYYILLLRSLKKTGIKLAPSSNRARTSGKTAFFQTPKETRFFGNGFFLTITKHDNQSLDLTVSLESNHDITAKHRFAVNPKYSFLDFQPMARKAKDTIDTFEAVSVWSLAEINPTEVDVVELGSATDQEVMDAYLSTKLLSKECSKSVYELYCPSCRDSGMRSRKGVFTCPKCRTRYAIYQSEGKDRAFFLRLRRPR